MGQILLVQENKSNRTEVLEGCTNSAGFLGAIGTCPLVWASRVSEGLLTPCALVQVAYILQREGNKSHIRILITRVCMSSFEIWGIFIFKVTGTTS